MIKKKFIAALLLFVGILFFLTAVLYLHYWNKNNNSYIGVGEYEQIIKRNLDLKKRLDQASQDYKMLDERTNFLISEIKKLNKENSTLRDTIEQVKQECGA
jgi:cell division protein FtsB